MTHYLLDRRGGYDRRAINARAAYLHRTAIERGAGGEGEETRLGYWLRYFWRVARGQREAAAWSRVEAMARAVTR
jgi:hypothetical protein